MTLQDFAASVATYTDSMFWAGVEFRGGCITKPDQLTWRATVMGEFFEAATPEDCLTLLRAKFAKPPTAEDTAARLADVEVGM